MEICSRQRKMQPQMRNRSDQVQLDEQQGTTPPATMDGEEPRSQ